VAHRARAILAAVLLVPFLAAAPLRAAGPNAADTVAATSVGLERVILQTGGGVPFPVDCYRPSGTVSRGTAVLLPDPVDSLAIWGGVARLFAGRGIAVFVPQIVVRRAAASLAVWGRPEDPGAPWAAAWEEVVAVLEFAEAAGGPGGPVVLGGTGLGAAAAAVAASRLSAPPVALLLIAPVRELVRLPVGPLLAGLAVPALVLAPTDDPDKVNAAREILLAARITCRLWTIDGYACSPRTLRARPKLAVDLADWIGRELSGGTPAVDAEGPPPEERKRR
jgi:predicted alpha/beta-hydrolase family hydrolase